MRRDEHLPANTRPAILRADEHLPATTRSDILQGTGELPAGAPSAGDEGSPGSFDGGVFKRQGNSQESGLLHDVLFDPEGNSVSFGISNGEIAFLTYGSPKTAVVSRDGVPLPSGVVQFTSSSLVVPKNPLCGQCDFLEWGGWKAHLNHKGTHTSTNLFAEGWWVSGTVTAVPDLNILASRNATASYAGTAWGSVINQEATYDASGKLDMSWSFAQPARHPGHQPI